MASEVTKLVLPQARFVDLRLPNNKLVAKYDPRRGVLELKIDGALCWFDLTTYQSIESVENSCYTENR